MEVLFIVAIWAVLGGFFLWEIYCMFDHSHCPDKSRLSPKAQAVSMDSKYSTLLSKFKTTVTFSDGFVYVTHKTKSQRVSFNKVQNIVDKEMKMQILDKAIAAHNKAVSRR